MSQRIKFARTPLSIVCQFSLLLQGLTWIPSIGIVGDGIEAKAQNPLDSIDEIGTTKLAPPPVGDGAEPENAATLEFSSPAPKAKNDDSVRHSALDRAEPDPLDSAAVAPWQPSAGLEDMAPVAQSEPAAAAADTPWVEEEVAVPDPLGSPAAIVPPETESAPVSTHAETPLHEIHQNNLYVDPTDYSMGATEEQQPADTGYAEAEPPAAEPYEAADNAQTLPPLQEEWAAIEATPPPPPSTPEVAENSSPAPAPHADGPREMDEHVYAEELPPPASIQEVQQANLYAPAVQEPSPAKIEGTYSPVSPQPYTEPESFYSPEPEPAYYSEPGTAYASLPDVPAIGGIEPVNVGPVKVSSTGIHFRTKAGARNFDTKRLTRPSGRLGNGNTSMIFPLPIPVEITSLFGWRTHPLFGDRRFHSGIDLAAPLGTPVLAAYAGTVAISQWLGGYGQTVVLQHNDSTEETLYGHLSELLVEPGEFVEQGDVIGRVGSTGNSTGPHLHFEQRQLTPEGWVALDPGTQLEFALTQLIAALEIPQPTPEVSVETIPPALVTLPSLEVAPPPPPVAFLQPPATVATLDVPAPPPLPALPIPVTLEVPVPATVEAPNS